jgi:peroxiredoxin
VRDEIDQFEAAGIRPFGVNPASVEAHAAYARRLALPFTLLSDPGLHVARAFGAVRPDGDGVARSVVLVGRDGRVRYAQHGAPGAALILEAVEGR